MATIEKFTKDPTVDTWQMQDAQAEVLEDVELRLSM